MELFFRLKLTHVLYVTFKVLFYCSSSGTPDGKLEVIDEQPGVENESPPHAPDSGRLFYEPPKIVSPFGGASFDSFRSPPGGKASAFSPLGITQVIGGAQSAFSTPNQVTPPQLFDGISPQVIDHTLLVINYTGYSLGFLWCTLSVFRASHKMRSVYAVGSSPQRCIFSVFVV